MTALAGAKCFRALHTNLWTSQSHYKLIMVDAVAVAWGAVRDQALSWVVNEDIQDPANWHHFYCITDARSDLGLSCLS